MGEASAFVDTRRLIEAFLSTKKTATTRSRYGNDLRKFVDWCDARAVHLLEVTAIDLNRYFKDLSASGLAASTVGANQAAIASFYDFVILQSLLPTSPMTGMKRPPKVREPETSPLSREDFAAVIAATEKMPDPDAAVVLLAGINGLKPNEIVSAEASGLQELAGFWSLALPNRSPDAKTVLPPIVADRVIAVVGDRRSGPLLGDAVRDRFQVNRIIARAGRQAGLSVSLTSNILRTTMMSVALSAGSSPGTLSKATGLQDPRAFVHLMPVDDDVTQHPAVRVANAIANAPVTEDLLQQVAGLVSDQSIHPVAPIVLLGAILESRLRSMVQQTGTAISGTPGISRYIETLRQANAITPLEWRELQVWAELRNQAAHGRDLDSLTHSMAQKMEQGVSDFLHAHQ